MKHPSLKLVFLPLLLVMLLVAVPQTVHSQTEENEIEGIEKSLYQSFKAHQEHKPLFWQRLRRYMELNSVYFHLKEAQILIDSLDVQRNSWNNSEKGQLYLYKAIVAKYQDNYALSKYNFLTSREYIFKTNYRYLYMNYYLELAEFNRKIGNLDSAYRQIHTAYKIYKTVPYCPPKKINKLYNRLAAIANENNRQRESIAYSKRAIQIARKYNYQFALGVSYNEIGFSYKNLGMKDSAEYFYEQAAKKFLTGKYYTDYIQAEQNRGILYFHNNYKRQVGYQIFLDIEKLVKEKKLNYSLNSVYEILMHEAELKNDLKTQLYYWNLYHKESINYMSKREKSAILAVEKSFQEKKLSIEKAKIKRNYNQSIEHLKDTRKNNFLMSITLIFLISVIGLAIYLGVNMRKLNRQLVVQDSFNKRMMAVISHDLKGSMYLISILGKRITNQPSEITRHETITRLNNQIGTSNEILDSLLKWLKSSFTKTKLPARTTTHLVWEIVKREFQEKINEKGIEIIVESQSNTTIDLPADVLRISMRNLLSNAIKYSYDRSSIIIRFDNNTFQVQDFGIGIESERIAQLFESDVISINGTLEESGFGIGLYMTYNLLQEYGFSVLISSELDEGTTITIQKV